MIKDYAKLKQQQQPTAKKVTRWLPLSLLTLVALALLIGLISQIHWHAQQHKTKRKVTPPSPAVTKPVTKPVTAKAEQAKPVATEFEFYQLLSKKAESTQTKQQSTTATLPVSDNTATGEGYQLQAASLHNRLDAQRFARQLLTLGFQSTIQPFLHPDGTTWYRVMIGPIDSYANAKQTQAMLHAQHIDSLLSRSS
ncbi:MAG: SPOR domain-containing protein [Coxiellaceae bacterium]|nr:SPOR domain-containing protein [Coxiellaceae bacterium]